MRGHTARVHTLADGPHTTHSRRVPVAYLLWIFPLRVRQSVGGELERVGEELEESWRVGRD